MSNFSKVNVSNDARTEKSMLSSPADDSAISFACIQVKENSLEGYTTTDAVVEE